MYYECKAEHEKLVENLLETLSMENDEDGIKCMCILLIRENGICAISYEDATIEDLIQMQGNIGMAITKRYMEMNYPSVINDTNRDDGDDATDD